MTTLIMAAILFLGVLAFMNLPISNLPDVDYPTITVTAQLPGASPETMANTVAQPMETEFMTIPGITNVTSSNTLGNTSIVLEFDVNKSMDSAALDVQTALSRAEARLPPNLPQPPTFRKVNPSDSPIIYLALTSDTLTLGELYTYGRTFIGQRLSMIEGVAQVLTYGSPFAVRVQVDPGELATRSLSFQEVAAAISNASPFLPTGQLDGPEQSYIIITKGQLSKASEFNEVIVNYKDQAPIRISDLGQAVDSISNVRQDLKYVDRDKIQPTVVLAVQRQPGANTVAVAKKVRAILPSILEQLPASVELNVLFSLAETIEESIREVEFSLIIALVLVVAVIFLYLGNLRDTIIPSIAMPMSIIATFWIMYQNNFTLDNLSLLALTLSTGFIVDDAIVVLENIVRHVEEGKSRWQAAIDGTKQISFTVLSMTISLIVVFIPLVYMAGLIGKILREFSIVMITVIAFSGFISLTLTPMLSSLFVATITKQEKKRGISRVSFWLNETIERYYSKALFWVLRHRFITLVMGLISIVLSILIFYYLPKDFIPDDDMGFFTGYTQSAQGTSPERMFAYQEKIIEIVRSDPSVKSFVSIAGNPQIRQGLLFVHLKPHSQRPSIQKVIQGLYPKFAEVPGMNVFLKNIPLINLSIGQQTKGAYQYTLQSLDTEALYSSAEKMNDRLQTLPSIQAVSSDLEIENPELHVDILRDQAYSFGIDPANIETTLLLAYSGNRVVKIQTPYDQYDTILEVLPGFQRNSSYLNSIYLKSPSEQLVPLNAVAEWKDGIGPASINHLSQVPAVTFSFNLSPGTALGTALQEIDKIAQEVVPENVIGTLQGAASKFEETIRSITFLIIIAIFAMYIVLGILYESFIHPITILSSLPPAILGGLATLYLFGMPLSLYGYLGIILLIGIVKKNGIIMIDYALDNIRNKNESAEKSIIEAALVRFRPIMMTTVAAIMGALPVALGLGAIGEARRPLGLVIIGGLLVSQLITLFLTPVIYLYLENLSNKLIRKNV